MAVTRQRPILTANARFEELRTRTTLNETQRGRLNNGGSFTLAANATQTTVSDDIVTTNSVILAMAETAEARDKPIYVPRTTILAGSFVAQHASTSNSACSFSYTVNC